jgi:hypothetical protein
VNENSARNCPASFETKIAFARASRRVSWIAWAAGTLAVAACSSGDVHNGAIGDDIVSQAEPIINGFDPNPVQTGDRRAPSTVRIYNRSYHNNGCTNIKGLGSGVLLENGFVLTAGHVLHRADGCNNPPTTGPFTPTPVSDIFVYSWDAPITDEPPTCNSAGNKCQHPSATNGIEFNPNNSDTAFIALAGPLNGTGNVPFGHFVPLFPYDEARYLNGTIWCTGYGQAVCGQPLSDPPALRIGVSTSDSTSDSFIKLIVANDDNQIPSHGDSGGPCWSQWNSETWPHSVLGISSTSGYCEGGSHSTLVAPPQYRFFANDAIRRRKSVVTFGFSSSSEVTWWARYNPPGASTNWVVQNGRYVESSTAGGTEPDGPMSFSVLEIHQNVEASVGVRSSGDDAAGIVFRYVDPEHYYFFSYRPETRSARIYKRKFSTFTLLASASVTTTWSPTTDVTLKVTASEKTFSGSINGSVVVSASDGEYPKGYTGIYKWKLNASFDNFKTTPKTYLSADWPI